MTLRTAAWMLRRSADRAEPLWPEVETALLAVLRSSSDLHTTLSQTPSSEPTGLRSRSSRATRSTSSTRPSPEPTSPSSSSERAADTWRSDETEAPSPSPLPTADGTASSSSSTSDQSRSSRSSRPDEDRSSPEPTEAPTPSSLLRPSTSSTTAASPSRSMSASVPPESTRDTPTLSAPLPAEPSDSGSPRLTEDPDRSSWPESSRSEPSSAPRAEPTGAPTHSHQESSPTSLRTATDGTWTDSSEDESTFWTIDEETDDETEEGPELTSGLSLPPYLIQRLLTEEFPSVRVRRLTPTECERLQGFPDGWTVPTVEALERWGRSISTQLDGTSLDALARSRSSSGWDRRSGPSSISGRVESDGNRVSTVGPEEERDEDAD